MKRSLRSVPKKFWEGVKQTARRDGAPFIVIEPPASWQTGPIGSVGYFKTRDEAVANAMGLFMNHGTRARIERLDGSGQFIPVLWSQGGKKRHAGGGDSGESAFDAGHAAGQKQAKKDASAGKDLWAIRQGLPTGSDYDLGFSVGYEIVAKDVAGPRGGIPVGHHGWVSGRQADVKFTPRGGGFASAFRGPSAIEQMRYHLRNARNIPTMDIDPALSSLVADVQRALKK
jgi:hypothetical protein